MTMPDFILTNCGSVWAFRPCTEAAVEFARDCLALEPWQWLGPAFHVDHRCVEAVALALQDEGFELGAA